MKYLQPKLTMKHLPFAAILALLISFIPVNAMTLFEDGFESGPLVSPWLVSSTNQGRVTVSTTNVPATGLANVVLDDSVSDATFSAAELTRVIDLSGMKDVVLTFSAKSLGNEPHVPPTGNFVGIRNFDGVSISVDGGVSWRSVQSLATVSASWTNYTIPLDSSVTALGGTFGPDFKIRFSQYDNSSVPLDGLAIDDVKITGNLDQIAIIDMPFSVTEGTGPHTGFVFLALPPVSPLSIAISTSASGLSGIPTEIIIPAGQTSASFQFFATDDTLRNLTRTITVTPTATGVTTFGTSVIIVDDETAPVLTLAVPAQLTEGAFPVPNNSTLSLSEPASAPLVISLVTSQTGELNIPVSIFIPAGQTQVNFTTTATNDSRIDGNVTVTVTATAPNFVPATAQVLVVDNENLNLSMTLPSTLIEGETGSGTVSISGVLNNPLTVGLAASNGAAAPLTGTVTIPAGATQVSFSVVATDNPFRDGSRSVNFTATSSGFITAIASLTIRDNEVASYRFSGVPDIVNLANPVPTAVVAADVEGNLIPNFSGSVNLSLVLPNGSSQPISPASVLVSGATGWTGNLTLPIVSQTPLKLRASDANGNSGNSGVFDIMRTIPLTTSGMVWDSLRGRIYASVPTGADPNFGNRVVSIDPTTLQIVGSLAVNQDPGQIVITSGGEAIYVALRGNGTITKVRLSDFTVEQNFAIGTGSFGTQFAEDMSAVAGQPNLLVVSRFRKNVSPRHDGVVVFDNGVARSVTTQSHTGSNVIEPSTDPSIFFGYNTETTEFGLRRLQLGSTGMTEIEVKQGLISGFSTDIRSCANRVFSNSGSVVDGALLRGLGTFPASGLVCPDEASSRTYFLEATSQFASDFGKVGAYDLNSFSLIRRLTLPAAVSSPKDFIRWGNNGLAFRTANTVVLIGSNRLVPTDPPADLVASVQATPNPASVGQPLTYTVKVTNVGPNTARNVVVSTTLSTNQALISAVSTDGNPTISGLLVSLPISELASGAMATLNIVTAPQSAGSLTCLASANSDALDSNFSNNLSFKLVSVGFQTAQNAVNELRLTANNLIYDPTRNLLWASIPNTVDAPLGKSIVSIDPLTGLISDPIPLNANPFPNSMALSTNGRYLYVGLTDVPEVHRIDLSLAGYRSLRIPLGPSQWGSDNYAQDIEPLDGDGTSFLMAGANDHSAAVYDGSVRRTTRTGIYSVDRIERTESPNIFIGYNNHTSGYDLTRLSVTASGVAEILNKDDVINGYSLDLHGVGNRVLSSSGLLVDSTSLTLRANLGTTGRPTLDLPNGRAYLVNGNALRAFDLETGNATGSLPLPTTSTGDWAKKSIRWGLDGFAVLGNKDDFTFGSTNSIFIVRWSSVIPPGADSDMDGIVDSWEATNFNTLTNDVFADSDNDGTPNAFEYFLATSPLKANGSMINSSIVSQGQNKFIRLVFPRRAGLTGSHHGYEVTHDLSTWSPVLSPLENVLSTQTVDGVNVETVEALIPAPQSDCGFVRMRWRN